MRGPECYITGVGTGCGPKGAFTWVKYPAIDALHRIGKPATAALVQAIANSDEQSTEGKHALYALMDIYRGDVNGGLRLLKNAATAQTNANSASRLENAAQEARLKWCKYARPACTE
jgi:hypothetical protein